MTSVKIGYVLSGGGARGIGHLGVIKALEEQGLNPSIISGTSAGAIIGAFFQLVINLKRSSQFLMRAKYLTVTT